MSPPDAYRQDIQGLRAIAVVSVLVFHAFPGLLSGGFAGVDIFFVISGFLISSILYRDIQSGEFALLDFYRNRVRRLFPALIPVLIATLALGYLVLSPLRFDELARSTMYSALFLANLDFYLMSGYFSQASELKPLLHTWSLAVEEQFYLVFPPLLWLVVRYAPRTLLALVALIFVLSLGLSQWLLSWDPSMAFFLSPFRAFELLAGVMVALMPCPTWLQRPALRSALAAAGLILIALALFNYSPQTVFPGVAALIPVLGTAFVLLAGRKGDSPAARLISLPPFLFFGAISYSLYLWHWPILSYLKILTPLHGPGPIALIAALLLSVGLATLSYRFVERPFSRRSIKTTPFLRTGLASMAVLCLAGFAIRSTDGLPGRFSPEVLALFAGAQDFSPDRSRCHRLTQLINYDQTCVLGADQKGVAPDTLVFGDSHGAELAFALAEQLRPQGRALRQITSSGCPPVLGAAFAACDTFNARILLDLAKDPNIETVVLTMNAEQTYMTRYGFETLRAGYEQTLAELKKTGKKIILVSQIPNINAEAPTAAALAQLTGRDPAQLGRPLSDMRSTMSEWNAAQARLSRKFGFELFDPIPSLCRETLCPLTDAARRVLHFNPTHISVAGARHVAKSMVPML